MARISFKGFTDPVSRPRYIIWALVAILVIAGVMIPVLGITSTRWFCSEGCHKVQDDTITAYQHSPHAEISCMACHMPVAANPVIFLIHKAEALGELAQTVTNSYELPLNAESEVALTMTSDKCTQCHSLKTRNVTPSPGIRINHDIHSENEVNCTICHNRTAHVENFDLTLKNPKSGEPSTKHADFMTMTACFRCHSQTSASEAASGTAKAEKVPTGKCEACHTPEFKLKPPSHEATGFYPAGHAELAIEADKEVVKASGKAWFASASGETSAQVKEGEKENGPKAEESGGPELMTVEQVNVCSTCHTKKFCTDCHGLPMPHPPTFKKEHGAMGKADPNLCAKCHGNATTFCDECHHGTALKVPYDPAQTWRTYHPTIVNQVGASACFECHNPTYCANCHVNGPGKGKQ
jgi:hypothetical protein